MKKIILSLILLTIALVSPAFASEAGDMEIDLKLGYTLDNNVKLYVLDPALLDPGAEPGVDSGSINKNFILWADFYFYVNSQVALGFGVNNMFDSTAEYGYDDKYGFTNIYFSVRPKMDLDSDILESIYFLAQAGYGFIRFDSGFAVKPHMSNGFYWAMGVGVEIVYDFFLEFIHSFNYGSADTNNYKNDITYSAFSVNVGYKFRFKP